MKDEFARMTWKHVVGEDGKLVCRRTTKARGVWKGTSETGRCEQCGGKLDRVKTWKDVERWWRRETRRVEREAAGRAVVKRGRPRKGIGGEVRAAWRRAAGEESWKMLRRLWLSMRERARIVAGA